MHLYSILRAIALATPLLAQSSPTCLGFDGLFFAQNKAQPCNFTTYLYVDDQTVATCQGQGTSGGPVGPWSATCLPGISLVVAADGFSATYTNSTGSYTRALVHNNPSVFATCATTQYAQSFFVSSPNDCIIA